MAERTASTTNTTVLVSLLAGLTGATVALLFAPRSGKETRESLKTTANDAKGRAESGLQSARDSISENANRVKEMKDRLAAAISHSDRPKSPFKGDESRPDAEYRSDRESSVLNNWEEEV